MPLESPNLDDRTFQDLLEDARRRAVLSCPGWTDLSPGDPGMVLLELFAYLTEIMLYRLNRIPEKAFIEFLRLIGVKLQPPGAAAVRLRFTRSAAGEAALEIPRGTRVSVTRTDSSTEPPVFVTAHTVTIARGETAAEVLAHHCELIQAEALGKGTGMPGLSLHVKRPPIVSPTGDELDLVIGVEAAPGELEERTPALQHGGKPYRIWREVDGFTNPPHPFVYVADRMEGLITFAPAARMPRADGTLEETAKALAAVPAADRDIVAWYRRGSGPSGNVAANTLTTLKDAIPGVQVTNPMPATGGRAAESLENALIRGPHAIHSLERAVTARDFEMITLASSGAIARAKALTMSMMWVHAAPGTVEVLLVPHLPEADANPEAVTAARLRALETEADRARIQQALDERRPLGTACTVKWTRYKSAKVSARVVAHREENPETLRSRVLERLYRSINPLPSGRFSGWRFGEALRAFHVYDNVVAEPGVSYVDGVRLFVDEVPETEVRSIAADEFQPRTWYAASGDTLYRSLNDGDGWEAAGHFPEERLEQVTVSPRLAGFVAVCAGLPGDTRGSRVHYSRDCGETWLMVAETGFHIEDLAWIDRDGAPVLLLATEVGLYEQPLASGAPPVQVLVDPERQELGFWSVAVATDIRGAVYVALAAQNTAGVFLSSESGKSSTFRNDGLANEDVRVLAVQHEAGVSFLWAGLASRGGDDPGRGCFRRELRASGSGGWDSFGTNWDGGSCRSIAFSGPLVFAASYDRGVLRMDPRKPDAGWDKPEVGCGLPLREAERLFQRVDAVAVDPRNRLLMAAGPAGVYRSEDAGRTYVHSSDKVFTDKITLPDTWLFCSGEHDVTVVTEDETKRG
jgi:hypothetical protein